MDLTLNLSDDDIAALDARVAKYNAGSGQPQLTSRQYLEQIVLRNEIDHYISLKQTADLNSLTDLGLKFLAADSGVKQQVIQLLQ